MPDATTPMADVPTLTDALHFVAGAKAWLEHDGRNLTGLDIDCKGSAVTLLDRAEDILLLLAGAR